MARKKKRGGGVMAALFGVGILAVGGVALAAGRDEETGTGPDGGGAGTGDGEPYRGPGPNTPSGEPTGPRPSGPSVDAPPEVAPDDLWIAPDCTDVIVGANWLELTARPAIEEWAADGIPYRTPTGALSNDPSESPEFVVRAILGPYAPLCVDTWPWIDVLYQQIPEPQPEDFPDNYEGYLSSHMEWNAKIEDIREAAGAENPKFAQLVGMVAGAVLDVADGGAPTA